MCTILLFCVHEGWIKTGTGAGKGYEGDHRNGQHTIKAHKSFVFMC